MVLGLGTDMIEVKRVERLASKGESYLEGIFTTGEIAYCDSKRFSAQHLAARFAAKEAFLKALGTGWREGIRFVDIEIHHTDQGAPKIHLTGKAKEILTALSASPYYISVSMSHLKEYATATVIIETRE